MSRVIRLFLVAASMLLLPGPASASANPAQITLEKRIAPRVIELTISTPAFTAPTHVDVDLPVGYDADRRRHWPVAYVLAGTMNTYASFNDVVSGVRLTQSFPAIVVSPNGDSGYWSDWYNGGALGPPMYKTYVIDQLIPLIDANFRTIPTRSQRAILGISMGGDGAMMYAAQHPDLFAYAASLSGAVDTNLPYIAAAVTASPEFQGGQPDAIYGPRATQEVRWHGHNPTDLAGNLRRLDLQVRTANGFPNPGIGENPASADTAACVIEQGVYQASISLDNTLNALQIPHLWKDYGPGCHTVPNFEREIIDTFQVFNRDFAHPLPAPRSFDYVSIQPEFDVWGWHVKTDTRRALEFLRLTHVSPSGLSLTGSGTTSITTPPWFRGLRHVDVTGAWPATVAPDATGRIRFTVDLGPPNTGQQYAPGVTTTTISRTITLRSHAVVDISRVSATARGLRVCARAIGGPVRVRVHLLGPQRRALARSARLNLSARSACYLLRWAHAPNRTRATIAFSGSDRFGHRFNIRRTVRLATGF